MHLAIVANGQMLSFDYDEYSVTGLTDHTNCAECRVLFNRDGPNTCEDRHCDVCLKPLGSGRHIPVYPCEDCYPELRASMITRAENLGAKNHS